jgi:hypothetical protein
MKFKQYKDGSCDIIFSWKEIFILLRKRKLHLSSVGLRHFGNVLMKMVIDWNVNLPENVKKMETNDGTVIEGTIATPNDKRDSDTE